MSLIGQADNNFTSSDNVTYMRKASDALTSDIVIPIFSLVITIEDGKIKSTAWDNGCWDCTALCYLDKINANNTQSNCRVSPCNLTGNSLSTTACDPKVYVSWIGTDANGNHMSSAGFLKN